MDLVRQVISAAGNLQAAGDICRMSVLNPAILAVLKGKKDSLEMLTFLLRQGASTQTPDTYNLPAIMQVLCAGVLYLSKSEGRKVKEGTVFNLVQLLLKHGATLNVINPNSGEIPLMAAMDKGYKTLFDFFLEHADADTFNQRAYFKPNYLVFQLLDRHRNRLSPLDTPALLPQLKRKGVEFDKVIDYKYAVSPFGATSHSEKGEVFAQNISLLHFYIENLTRSLDDLFYSMDTHLEIIQALITNGTNPNSKAMFVLTKEKSDGTKEKTSMELTAAEYLRKIADKVIDRYSYSTDAYLIKTYQNEHEFLEYITYETKERQTRLHQRFHQFRNLERVLSGEKPLSYSGLPNVRKIEKLATRKEGSFVKTEELNPNTFEAQLISARILQKQNDWKNLKNALVAYVKEAGSLENFLARVGQFKKPLQLHFDVTTDATGNVVSYGSRLYRFFHYFDPYHFPNSWESLRQFGQDIYGVDINTQYAQNNTVSMLMGS